MDIIVFFQGDVKHWNVNGELFKTKTNAIANAKHQLKGIGGSITVFNRANGQYQRTVKVAA